MQQMDDFIIGTEPRMVLRYPLTVQVISGSTVTMSHVSGAKELLQSILDLRPGEAINIVLTTQTAQKEVERGASEPPREAQHLCYEVDIGLSAVPCIYVSRNA